MHIFATYAGMQSSPQTELKTCQDNVAWVELTTSLSDPTHTQSKESAYVG